MQELKGFTSVQARLTETYLPAATQSTVETHLATTTETLLATSFVIATETSTPTIFIIETTRNERHVRVCDHHANCLYSTCEQFAGR